MPLISRLMPVRHITAISSIYQLYFAMFWVCIMLKGGILVSDHPVIKRETCMCVCVMYVCVLQTQYRNAVCEAELAKLRAKVSPPPRPYFLLSTLPFILITLRAKLRRSVL